MSKGYIHPSAEVASRAEIGEGTKIWNQAQIREGVRIGKNCVISKDVYIDTGVVVGNGVKIQNGVPSIKGSPLRTRFLLVPTPLSPTTFDRARSPKTGRLSRPSCAGDVPWAPTPP